MEKSRGLSPFTNLTFVMRGLDPRIHFLLRQEKMDCRVIGGAKRRRSSNGYARQ
jgi:hypothetical protein